MAGAFKQRDSQLGARVSRAPLLALIFLSISVLSPFDLNHKPAYASQAAKVDSRDMKIGQQTFYSFSYANESHSDVTTLFNAINTSNGDKSQAASIPLLKRNVCIKVSGQMEMTLLEKSGSYSLIYFRAPAVDSVIIFGGQIAADESLTTRKVLGKGFPVKVGHDGRVTGVWIGSPSGGIPSSVARALVSLTQFVVRPESPIWTEQGWETDEEDASGRYRARYKRTEPVNISSKDDLPVFSKTKLSYFAGYARKHSRSKVMSTAVIPSGELNIRYDPKRQMLISVQGGETNRVEIEGKQIGTSDTAFVLQHTGNRQLAGKKLSGLLKSIKTQMTHEQPTPLWIAPSHDESDAIISRQTLGGDTLETLFVKLSDFEAMKIPWTEASELYLKFKALIYLHPESCKLLAGAIADRQPENQASQMLLAALSAVANPAAQEALVGVIGARSGHKQAIMQIIFSLAVIDEPSEIAEQRLRDFAYSAGDRELAAAAQLALGGMARNLSVSSPGRSRAIIDYFMAQQRADRSTSETVHQILVLGNAGLEDYLPVLSRFAEDERREVRANAIHALRHYESAAVSAILFRALVQDREALVRFEAAIAIGSLETGDEMIALLIKAFAGEKVQEVRIAILQTLWKSERKYPEVRKLVTEVAEKDPSEAVRKAAIRMIN